MTDHASIDEHALHEAAARVRFSGVVTVDVADRRVLERAYGYAHRGHRVPNTVETRFGIASGGKAFTALAVLRLVEAGTVGLRDPARRYLALTCR
jgi:CubicO group peptidase (beta-lactamase class C family)